MTPQTATLDKTTPGPIPDPTHAVRLRHVITGAVKVLQCFSRYEAEWTLKVYREYGWNGTIEARRR